LNSEHSEPAQIAELPLLEGNGDVFRCAPMLRWPSARRSPSTMAWLFDARSAGGPARDRPPRDRHAAWQAVLERFTFLRVLREEDASS